MLCLFVLLQLSVLAVSQGSGEGDPISPAPTNCTGFTEFDGKRVPHMETEVGMDGGRLVVHVKCEEGYLLVPKNATTLLCNETTGKWIFPQCLEARLSLIQPFYIFTIAQQLLTFSVSYRTCPIQVTLCLNDTELGCRDVTIPTECGDVCVVDLVEQNSSFSFYQRKIGQYSANLTTTQKDCLVHIDSKNTTIELTLTPEEIQAPYTTKCNKYTEEDKMPHVIGEPEFNVRFIVNVKCEEGYLLVPKNATTLRCNKTTGKWIFPQCREIPKVKFVDHSLSHIMGSENPPKILVSLTAAVVREFVVEIAVKEEESTAVNPKDFELHTDYITFSDNETTVRTVSVTVADTHVSGKNKNFTLCLSIARDESVNETRTKVEDGSACVTVTINNTNNKARLSLIQPFYIFTIAQQLLTFSVSYRTCTIQVTLCLIDTELGCKTVTIPTECGDVCVVDLVEQNNSFSFYQSKIGQYSANLTTTQKDCLVNIDNKNTTIELTLTPEEIQERGTEIAFAQGMYNLFISDDRQWAEEHKIIHLAYTRGPDYAFQLRLNVTTVADDSDPLTWSTDVIVLPHCHDNINISKLLWLLYSTRCGMTDTFNLELTALTSTSVAIVKTSPAPVRLRVMYGTTVSFNSSSYFQSNDAALAVTISNTRCLGDLSQYITVQISHDGDDGDGDTVKTLSTSANTGGTMDWGYTWIVDNIPLVPLHHYTLSLMPVGTGKNIAWGIKETKYISGAVLSFDEKSYTFEDNSVKVKVRSSRPLPGSSLRDLVILNIVGVPPKNSATSASGAGNTSATSMFEIKADVEPTEEGHSVWVVTVNVTDDYKEKISSATITLVVTEKMKGIIKLGNKNMTVIHVHAPTSGATPTAANELSTSWFSGTIAVLIAAVVVAVAIYVVLSRREQIVVWLKTTGGGEGGRKMLTKARTCLHSRGAYKKLPTSI